MKYISKILFFLVGAFSIIYILIWVYEKNHPKNETIRWYVNGGFEKMTFDDNQDSIYTSGYMNDTLIKRCQSCFKYSLCYNERTFKKGLKTQR